MITEIGIVAGEIWYYLEGHGESMFNQMVREMGRPSSIVLMSLGWLAREGHVIVRAEGDDFRLTLRR